MRGSSITTFGLLLMAVAAALPIAPPAAAAVPAAAAERAAAATAAAAAATQKMPANDALICRREQVLGSHMTRRVCRTRSQMEADRNGAAELMRSTTGAGRPSEERR